MSTNHHHIIAGYDGSDTAAAAAEWAAAEAVRRGCPLTVVGCYRMPVAVDYAMAYTISSEDLRRNTEEIDEVGLGRDG